MSTQYERGGGTSSASCESSCPYVLRARARGAGRHARRRGRGRRCADQGGVLQAKGENGVLWAKATHLPRSIETLFSARPWCTVICRERECEVVREREGEGEREREREREREIAREHV